MNTGELLCFLFELRYFARIRRRASCFVALRVEVVSLPVQMKLTRTNMISQRAVEDLNLVLQPRPVSLLRIINYHLAG